jgi:hypothetical protein
MNTAEVNCAWLRDKIEERGWTEQIEAEARQRFESRMSSMSETTVYGEVPVIRDWFTPAYRSWQRSMYGQRGFFFAFGWLFLIMLVMIALKAAIFWGVVAVMLVLYGCTATYDILSWRHRVRLAMEAVR